jgi:2-polyprenyl-3-methyl-5-hydroxy-6-metoxy-1,4-benzoquinol methylase
MRAGIPGVRVDPRVVTEPDPVTTFCDDDEPDRDVGGGALGASLVTCAPSPTESAVLHLASVAQPIPRGAIRLDLNDINDARTLAVLSVPPQSRVLDVGSGAGDVACALAGRGCHVWGIDIDAMAAEMAEPWCDDILRGDVETADLAAFLGPQRVDVILFLDVLEHLRDPVAAIRRVLPFLAPGGRIILSVPHVAHAAVRLQLLAGAFPRTSKGLLDRKHLHFFDRSSLHELLRHAGVRVIDEARVVRSLEETEIPLDLTAFPREAIELATAGPDADTYSFVVTAAPGVGAASVDRMPTLVSTLTERVHRVELDCRRLRQRVMDLDSQLERHRGEHDRLHESLEEAREGQRRSAAAAAVLGDELRCSELEREQFEQQVARTTDELVRCQLERRFLRDDVLVKDAYLATLRQHATQNQQAHADIAALNEKLDDLTARYAAETRRANDLAESDCDMRQQLDQARQELQRVHISVADTLAQPRYVIADRCNAWARRARFLHASLKRACSAWSRGE